MAKSLIVCDCLGSQPVDRDAIEAGTGVKCSRVFNALCTKQSGDAADAIAGGEVMIACGQEHARFAEIAAEIEADIPQFVDIRDRAGWSDEAAKAGPKQAALVADALLGTPAERSADVVSEGLCLIVGAPEVALPAADKLADQLAVTVLLTSVPDDLPMDRRFEVTAGQLRNAAGSFGGFEVRIDALRQIEPGGRGGFAMTDPRDGAETSCDLIVDLTGGTPLFPAPEKRDGYLRADPGDPNAVAALVLEASQMTGTFEKTLFVRLEEPLCAHSRAEKIACTRCLDVCPTGAITSAGEHVAIDPMICAGCGACSALCPSGAITYEAPPVSHIFRRLETMAASYRKAGGANPRLLVHDNTFGAEMIALCARFGQGLPADVIPMGLETISGFGHAEVLAALGAGFATVDLLLAPNSEREVLAREVALASAMGGDGKIRLLDLADPDQLADALALAAPITAIAEPILPIGTRKQVARMAAKALNPADASVLPLPDGAPYGAVLVDTDACTLCLACASLCPSGALVDNPDTPQLRFQEDACLQCGLCANVCPETAISLVPQFDLSDAAYAQKVMHEEEPFECVECGTAFGVKSTIERIVEKLAGKNAMFANEDAVRMIRMCDNCRINAQYHSENNPFAGGERPKPRTTDDYYSERKDH